MKKFYLASASPRRREILDIMGITHTVLTAPADESVDTVLTPKEAGEILAARKSLALKNRLVSEGKFDADTLILAADTLVYLDGEPLGKPQSENDALDMLTALSGREHIVCTGTCLIHGSRSVSASEVSIVRMRAFSREEALSYVATGEPLDKAGAYGIQGKGAVLVDSIDGDFFSIMGLSPKTVAKLLSALGLDYFKSLSEFSK
ncbi:MAG: septum formation protein Maf [Clostridia bacterium]|nr:septum formation protein Maf [Clostridia bacterium]